MDNRLKYLISIWLGTCALFVLLTVLVGGMVRLTHSGLSIVEWKPVTGIIPPINQEAWQQEFKKYQQFPEYKNKPISLKQYKFIYWWEYIHRLIARLLGLIFFIPFLIFWLTQKLSIPLIKHFLVLLLLGMLQGFIGWYMVKSGLVNKPSVSHYRLAVHLSLAYFIFCYILWLIANIWRDKKVNDIPKKVIGFIRGFIILLSLQIIFGAFVAGLKAGYIYNTFPLMGNTFIPQMMWNQSLGVFNLFENPVTVQFIHRILGYLIFIKLIVAFFYFKKYRLTKYQAFFMYASIDLGLVQILLGILTLVHHVPIVLAVAHQTTALLLLGSFVLFIHAFLKK